MRMPFKIENKEVIIHYDSLIDEGNDPVLDCEELKAYMELWDGQTFIDLLELKKDKSVLEIGCGTGRIALKVANAVGAKTLALTGISGGALAEIADVLIGVPEHETYKVQEYHLPVYHYLCAEVEKYFFK